MSAAATCPTPLSVASRLNCAAAFLVSWTSNRIPWSLRYLRTAGARGTVLGPVPMMSRSVARCQTTYVTQSLQAITNVPGFGYNNSNTPQACSGTSHCPFAFSNLPVIASSPVPPSAKVPSFLPSRSHGFHRYASPPIKRMPHPLMRIWLLSAKPSPVQASMDVAGATVFRRTSRALKSVCVSSSLFGPRSRVLGGLDWRRAGRVVCRQRACRADAITEGLHLGRLRHEVWIVHLENARVHCSRLRSMVVICN